MPAAVTERDGNARFTIKVKPRSSRAKVLGFREMALEIAVTAPPVEGAANDEVRRVLAELLDVPKSHVAIVTGETSRTKVVEVARTSAAEVEAKLASIDRGRR